MPNDRNITLDHPITFGDQTISVITLRAPTLKELTDIGVIAEQRNFEVGWYKHVNWDRLGELIQQCVIAPSDAPARIGQVSAADTYKLIDAIGRLRTATHTAAANVVRGIDINPKTKGAS